MLGQTMPEKLSQQQSITKGRIKGTSLIGWIFIFMHRCFLKFIYDSSLPFY